ncbi:MAG: hypothetical protein QHH13_05045 [Melioribacter sp.]|uniref:sodium:solute symporter family transporter n=1 Tax=Rosettibacter primus TaxID=3111523 RepID=UPI00247C1AB1|nr:hypothetical protein [Melioribacter sp.]
MLELSMTGFILFIFYPLILISLSVYLSISKEMSSSRYFFAEKNINWFILGLSFLTSALISPYALGYTLEGFSIKLVFLYGIISSILFYILGKFIIPVYSKLKIKTISEFFERIYGRSCRYFISLLLILSNVGIRLILSLIAGSILISTLTELDPYFSLLFFLVITSIYLIIGGLKTEIIVSAIHVLFITIVTVYFTIWLITQTQTKFNLSEFIASAAPKFNQSLISFEALISIAIIGFWFICSDQIIVQKSLSAKNINQAKKSSFVSIIFQFVPVLIFSLPLYLIFDVWKDYTHEYILKNFFKGIVPELLQSSIILSLVFALTSTFANFFNSTSSLITYDFYKTIKKDTSDRELVLVGRITIIILLLVAILLIPVSKPNSLQLYFKLIHLLFYISAIVSAFLIIGLLAERINGRTSFVILCLSSFLIIYKFINELFYENDNSSVILKWFTAFNFLQFTIIIFLFCTAALFFLNKINWGLVSNKILKSKPDKKILLALPVYLAIIGFFEIISI